MLLSALIRNCEFKFKCDQSWDLLLRTEHYIYDKVRFCPVCEKNVYMVMNEVELFLAIEQNKCIAIPFDITSIKEQLDKPLLGSIKWGSI
jgi:hypothetical protein